MKPYYDHAGIAIYHGDCREVLPTLEAGVLVADPPYGLEFPYLTYDDTRENLRDLIRAIAPYLEAFTRSAILCGPSQIAEYPLSRWVGAVTWDTTGSFGKYGYSQWTPILLYGDDLKGLGNVNGVTKSDTFAITGGGSVGFQRSVEEKKHTCPKPIGIMRWVVQRFTEADAVVIDPFAGSGTTLRAAKDLGRRAIGIEIEERYCEIAAKRLAQEILAL